MRSGTHIFWCKVRWFECKKKHRWGQGPIQTCSFGYQVTALNAQNHWWGMGPIETSNSCANHTVLHAQKDRWGLVPIETCDFGAKHAVVFAQIDRWGLGPRETSNSGGKHADLHYWPYPVLIELNRAWVRALLALPSPYWAKQGLGDCLIVLI